MRFIQSPIALLAEILKRMLEDAHVSAGLLGTF
jgi:hypothetical protein